MDKLLLLLIIPVCWPIASRIFFGNRITWQEVGIQATITSTLTAFVWATGHYFSVSDYEIWNGYVTGKEKVYVSCSHSYPCNCRTQCSGVGDNRSCWTVCDTCYSHSNDWDWRVYTTLGRLNISRIDSRGSQEPPRWTQVVKGEPASSVNLFTNYVKASPDTLFKRNEDYSQFDDILPEYPKVYDYYRYQRVLNHSGVSLAYVKQLNDILNMDLRKMGSEKEVNIIVVFANTDDPSYRYALESKWLGGKKNDVVIIVGVTDAPNVAWTDVMTFGLNSGNEYLRTVINDRLNKITLDNPTTFRDIIVPAIREHFKRKSMEDFEYLKDQFDPPAWAWTAAIILSLIASIGLTIYFKDN